MVKFKVSLLLAVIAALTVVLAGLMSGARLGTVFLRALAGWLVALVAVYVILLFLESRHWLGFDLNIELPETEEEEAATGEADAEGSEAETEETASDAAPETAEEPEAAEAGFQPMQADNLAHMEVPSKS